MRQRIARILRLLRVRTVLPLLVAFGAIAALLIYANPGRIGAAFQRFNLLYLPIVVALGMGFYIVQGVRWWTLNRALHIRFPLKDTVFLTLTGQATALLPLGELTRALLVSKAASVPLGAVVASETVQELLFVFMLFVVALPTAISFHFVAIAVIVPLIFILAIVLVLTNEALYQDVMRVVSHVPVLRRIRAALDELHRDTRVLFRHPATYKYLPLSIAQALMAVSLLWFIAEAVDPGKLAWPSGRIRVRGHAGRGLAHALARWPRRGGGEHSRAPRRPRHQLRHRHRRGSDPASRRQGAQWDHRLDLLRVRSSSVQPQRGELVPIQDASDYTARGGRGSRVGRCGPGLKLQALNCSWVAVGTPLGSRRSLSARPALQAVPARLRDVPRAAEGLMPPAAVLTP